ncbi:MAG TPA: Gfo/Idh/MocA family oxidoreductase [Stellaceae bacterium]|nr:Gfo/Idh/MocA family oxidoreductase [Stellaceae bacterium]
MRVIIVGLGIQGRKRQAIAGAAAVATVDPVNLEADYRTIAGIPKDRYDAALVCTPDDAKVELLTELLGNGKHVLVEKPLLGANNAELKRLSALAKAKEAVCYVAYNHRFEPHFVRMKETIGSGVLGRIYSCRMFYGNGTARDVRNSAWRDQGAGVLPDLGSHLLDTLMFWFGALDREFRVWSADRFENRAFDHIVFGSRGTPFLEVEISLLSWRNHFTCDVFAENGSAHIESLCKWGPSTFTRRTRVLPSGRPPEESVTLVQADPTWAIEYEHFKRLCERGSKAHESLETDLKLNMMLNDLSRQALGLGKQ